MKICLIGTLPEAGRDAYRGPERTSIGLAEALDDRGHDVLLLSDEGDAETVRVPAEVVGRDLEPGVDRMVRLYRRLQHSVDPDEFDVVHSWRPAPTVDVYSAHSIDATETVEDRRPGTFSMRWRLGAKLELLGKRYTAMSCDVVAVTALQNAVDAASHGIEPTRIIPVGVDSSFLQSNEPTGGLPTVLCVGRIEPRKNQTFVAEHTPDAYALRLVGPQSSAYAERIPRFEEVWDGLLSPDDLARAYHRADIFVLPSVFEGFGLTAVEAMAAGTPVVVADTCGIADHVYDEPIGEVYRFDDPDTYRESLRLVRDRMEEYGRNARSYVEENLTWQTIAAQYEREYARSVRE